MIEGEVYFDRAKDIANARRDMQRSVKTLEKLDVNKAPATGGSSAASSAEHRKSDHEDDGDEVTATEETNNEFETENCKMRKFLFAGCCAILCSLWIIRCFAQNDGSQQNQTGRAGTFAIVGARIVTVSGATIENGTVVIQNGKIAAVGANVTVPAGAEKIDGKGLTVFPGMIDAGTNIGLAEITLGVPRLDGPHRGRRL